MSPGGYHARFKIIYLVEKIPDTEYETTLVNPEPNEIQGLLSEWKQ